MDPTEAALRLDIAAAAAGRDYPGWRDTTRIYADYLEERGIWPHDLRRAERFRRKALWARTPGCRWPRPGLLPGLSPHQVEQLRQGLTHPVALLTGTPGTGKTVCSASIIGAMFRRGMTAVCAPTGKAAVRLTAALRQRKIPLRAVTIHQLLAIGRNGHDGEGWGFQYNEDRKLPFDTIAVDEVSMLDAGLFGSLLRACRPGTHLLLVGDPNQLPPVGHGSPLRDLIEAGLPRAHLSEIWRNAGAIVQACSRIKEGQEFEVVRLEDAYVPEQNLALVPAPPNSQIPAIQGLAGYLGSRFAAVRDDPLENCQILCATNEVRHKLNSVLQSQLNPRGLQVEGNPFRAGDKVICLRNGWHQSARQDDPPETQEYVANGEIGRVIAPDGKWCVAVFTEPPRLIRFPLHGSTGGCDFDLGYAITGHKSQGSEFPVVIVVLEEGFGARHVCTREWLYTAISRASQICILVGRMAVARRMVSRVELGKRRTFLKEAILYGW